MKYNYDLIVVGAGTGGCTLAKKASKAGFRVALFDCRKKKGIGYPWEIAVEKHIFSQTCLKLPPPSLWLESPEKYRFYSRNLSQYVEMDASEDSVFYIQHKILNQLLLTRAIKAGVHFYPSHKVTDIIVNDNTINGIKGKAKFIITHPFSFTGKIIVNATGFNNNLSALVPVEFMILSSVPKNDLASAWQEVRIVNNEQAAIIKEKLHIEPGVYYANVGKYHAFQVFFLRCDNRITLMFGTAFREKGKDAEDVWLDFYKKHPYLGKRIFGGGRIITTRRSIDTMVGNGFLCLGDAACQTVPTIGSGASSSIYAADLAARTIAWAINSGDFSVKALWEYNHKYQVKRGAVLASYDIIRLFLQNLSLEQIHSLFNSGMLSDRNFIQLYSSHRIIYDIHQILDSLMSLARNPKLFSLGAILYQAISDSQKVLELYQEYPEKWDRDHFFRWRYKVDRLFEKWHFYKEFEIIE